MVAAVNRRGFIAGLAGFVACAPAIVRASSLMPVMSPRMELLNGSSLTFDGVDFSSIIRGSWIGFSGSFALTDAQVNDGVSKAAMGIETDQIVRDHYCREDHVYLFRMPEQFAK